MRVMVSGGFDPLHTGHLDLLYGAAGLGIVWAVVNSDAWLKHKKGYVFMPLSARLRLLGAIRTVQGAYSADDADGTVSASLRYLRPDIFANGGDRTEANPKEAAVCEELGIRQVFNVGGGKTASSCKLVKAASDAKAHLSQWAEARPLEPSF